MLTGIVIVGLYIFALIVNLAIINRNIGSYIYESMEVFMYIMLAFVPLGNVLLIPFLMYKDYKYKCEG